MCAHTSNALPLALQTNKLPGRTEVELAKAALRKFALLLEEDW